MWKMNVVFLQIALVAIPVSSVWSLSENDHNAIEKTMNPIMEKCFEPCGVKESKVEEDDFDPCLKKCFVKTLNVLNDKGQLNQDVMNTMFKNFVEDEAESKQKQKQFEDCYNDENSSVAEDAEAETKRTDIVFECLDSTLDECISEDDAMDARKTIQPIITKCLEECGLKKVEVVNGHVVEPCLKKCAVKKLKVLDDNNQLDRKVLHELFVSHIADEAVSANIEKRYEMCYDVIWATENKYATERWKSNQSEVESYCKYHQIAQINKVFCS
ncbi:unnamed protein product [Chrysodeixis includens]|uniref:Uncharacterized protein n=1 Tax=Chrysodeixis includens TaxID=689277 RepID=A0A9N8L2I9_CHRIL|nr:unnamed protein product [Chrysodeixis includens]